MLALWPCDVSVSMTILKNVSITFLYCMEACKEVSDNITCALQILDTT